MLRRQLFSYSDLLVHVQDFEGESFEVVREKMEADPAAVLLAGDLTECVEPFGDDAQKSLLGAAASLFYRWDGKPVGVGETLHSTVIVNRMDPAVIPEVSRLFADLDATDFPHHMGTRRRQLFSLDGVYFHLQDFTTVDGHSLIDGAWKEADPRFIKICRELDPLVKVYDPATWRSTADQIATRFYHWEASS